MSDHVFVLGASILLISMICLLDFGYGPTVRYFVKPLCHLGSIINWSKCFDIKQYKIHILIHIKNQSVVNDNIYHMIIKLTYIYNFQYRSQEFDLNTKYTAILDLQSTKRHIFGKGLDPMRIPAKLAWSGFRL